MKGTLVRGQNTARRYHDPFGAMMEKDGKRARLVWWRAFWQELHFMAVAVWKMPDGTEAARS